MKRSPRATEGFTLVELMVVIAIIATISAIAIPSLMNSTRAANERNASTSLRVLMVAENDFRSNDRDGNRIQDYWTGDVAGLYTMTSAAQAGNADQALKLIDRSIAGADSAPLAVGAAGRNIQAISQHATSSPKAGYWYYALVQDTSTTPAVTYRGTSTGESTAMGAVHSPDRFGFLAYPDVYPRSGKRSFILNEAGVSYAGDFTRSVKTRQTSPPTAPLAAARNWPTATVLKNSWSAGK